MTLLPLWSVKCRGLSEGFKGRADRKIGGDSRVNRDDVFIILFKLTQPSRL